MSDFLARTAAGRAHRGDSRVVVASAEKTANGNSGAIALVDSHAEHLGLTVDVTAVGADVDETLDLEVEWSTDGTTFASTDGTADTFAQILQTAGAQALSKRFDVKGTHYRIVWTVGGTTPQFTFSVAERAL